MSVQTMDKATLLAWRSRWKAVNQRHVEEQRRLSPEARFNQMEQARQLAGALQRAPEVDPAGDAAVRARWNRLRGHFLRQSG